MTSRKQGGIDVNIGIENSSRSVYTENKCETKNSGRKEESFAKAIRDSYVSESVKPVEELTLQEYKDYVYFKISEMRDKSHGGLKYDNCVIIDISEEGFAAMKADPEYEKWVFDKIDECLNYRNVWEKRVGTNYFILKFGKNKEELEEETWFSGEFDDTPKDKESFWDSRIRRQRELDRIYFEKLDKRRKFEKKLYEKSVAEKKQRQKEDNRKLFFKV